MLPSPNTRVENYRNVEPYYGVDSTFLPLGKSTSNKYVENPAVRMSVFEGILCILRKFMYWKF